MSLQISVSKWNVILLANSNQWYFNNLVKKPCHKTHCRCPHRLNLSFQSSRSCALPNIKRLKDKDLEFANSIRPLGRQAEKWPITRPNTVQKVDAVAVSNKRVGHIKRTLRA